MVVRGDPGDHADVAVEHALVVVVLELHDLVAAAVHAIAADELEATRHARVQLVLQRLVECGRAELAAVHRREHLDAGDRVKAEPRRDPLGDQLDDRVPRGLRIVAADEVEVGLASGGRVEIRQLAVVDAVRRDHDLARGGLAEDLGQPDHGRGLGGDHVGQHRSRAHRRQLIDIADEHELRARPHRRHQRTEQLRIDHRGLIDHDEIRLERILGPAREPVLVRLVFEEAVDRHRLLQGRLTEPLGRAAGGCAERDLPVHELREVDDGLDDGRLADAGAARDHDALVEERGLHGPALLARELEVRHRLERVDRRVDIERRGARWRPDQLREARRPLDLGLVRPR